MAKLLAMESAEKCVFICSETDGRKAVLIFQPAGTIEYQAISLGFKICANIPILLLDSGFIGNCRYKDTLSVLVATKTRFHSAADCNKTKRA